MGGSKYCVFFGCMSSSTQKVRDLSFFKLPMDKERRLQWLIILNRLDLEKPGLNPKSYVVCSKHFEKSSLVMTPRLKPDAMPVANEIELTRDQATQTTNVDISTNVPVKIEPEVQDTEESEVQDTESEHRHTEDSESEETDTAINIKDEIEVTETKVALPVETISVKRKPDSILSTISPKKIKLEDIKKE